MSFKVLKLTADGKDITEFTLPIAISSSDGLMSSLDKQRLDHLIETASEKIKVGSTDNSIPEEIITKLKFDIQNGFVLDLSSFNEVGISIQNFIKAFSDGLNTIFVDDTKTINLSASFDTGLKFNVDDNLKTIFINKDVRSHYKYVSQNPSVLHEIDHNLGTFFLDVDVFVEDAVNIGQWTNDLCRVQYVSPNRAEIWLTESANVIALFSRKE